MQTVYDSLLAWTRRTSTSFAELWAPSTQQPPLPPEPRPGDGRIYRLKRWPDLPDKHKTADVYRMLSVMSHRAVNRQWILVTCQLKPQQIDALLDQLVREGAVDVAEIPALRAGS